MYVLSHMTGAFAIVEPTRMLTMKIAPIYKKVGSDIRYILLNSSNNQFAPAMAMPGMLKHFPMLDTWRDVPAFAIKGIELSTELLDGTGITRTHMHMMDLPRMMLLGYLKEWIEGSIDKQEVLDRFKAEYGTIRGSWLCHVKKSFDCTNQTSMVYGRLERANSLAAHFGNDYANVTVSPGPTAVYVSALNRISSPTEYNEIKLNVGPFVVSILFICQRRFQLRQEDRYWQRP